MAKVTLEQTLQERARLERKSPTEAERKLQRMLNKKGYWRFRRKKPWGNQIIDLWCSVLYLGVNIDGPGEAEFRGERTLVLHFTQEEVLGEMEMVAQIVLAAAASQEAVGKLRMTR